MYGLFKSFFFLIVVQFMIQVGSYALMHRVIPNWVSRERRVFSALSRMSAFSSSKIGTELRLLPTATSNQVIILAGATSVGKSKVAQLLCEEHGNCEVVIADSVQIYKYLDIGSNKPSLEEQRRVPHHLVDICEPHETYSSGEFVKSAVPIIYDILNRGKVPIVVGGSTMYLQWLVQGTPDAPKASKEIEVKAESLLRKQSTLVIGTRVFPSCLNMPLHVWLRWGEMTGTACDVTLR